MKTWTLIVTLALLTLLVNSYDYKSDCSCPSWNGVHPEGSYTYQSSTGIKYSQNEEIINGVSWGKLINFANRIWLSKDAPAQRSTSKIGTSCPAGYRAPTGDELRALLDAAKVANSTDPKTFLINAMSLNVSAYYVSSEKTYPNITGGGDNNAWMFQQLYFKNGGQPVIESVSTYWIANKLAARCVLDTSSAGSGSSITVEGLDKVFLVNQLNTLRVTKNNLEAYLWRVNGAPSGYSNAVDFQPSRPGCHVVDFYAVFFGGVALRKCSIVWSDLQTGSDVDTTFSPSKVTVQNYSDTKVKFYNSMHFSSGSAPIAPKKDGGAYILFSRSDNMSLYVRTINNYGFDTSPVIALNKVGLPLDIVATPWGFVTLIIDKPNDNKLYLLGTLADGTLKFETTIMDNGPNPTNATNQIKFVDASGKLLFGMNAMYRPHNGRLVFLRDRIVSIFAHYNHFGLKSDGSRNDHTGDTVFSFNENGADIRLGWSWGASHSLIQNVAEADDKILTASLGDAYPQNIRYGNVELEANANVDPVTQTRNRVNTAASASILSGNIPGNGGGRACGNIGGLSYMNNNIAVASYTRKSCNTSFGGVVTVNDKNEVGILTFDKTLKKLGEYPFADGSRAHVIKSAKYGRNVLLAIGTTATSSASFLPTSINYNTDTMSFLLVSPDGRLVTPSTPVTPFALSPADDWRVLNDGTVVWTFIGSDGYLRLYRVSL